MTRRDFAKGLFAAGAVVPPSLFAAEAESPSAALKVTRYSVAAGASRPFRVLHVSDTHLSLVDRIDGQPSPRNAEERAKCFPRAEEGLNAALAYARERGETIVHTGDLIDYVNDGNLAVAGKMADLAPGGVFAAGNHEYCKMVGDGKVEDEAYKAESRARVQSAYPGNLLFASRVVNGVNFVSFDNIYYYVPAGVPEMFEAEAAQTFAAYQRVRFYPAAGRYRDGVGTEHATVQGNAMALACGVPFAAAGWANDIPEIERFMRQNSNLYFKKVSELENYLVGTEEKGGV